MRSKDIIYKNEQEELLIKVLRIIGIKGGNKRINREDLLGENIIEGIKEIEGEIRKYYRISKFRSYSDGKERYLNLIRNLCKHSGIEILKLQGKRYEGDDKKERRTYVIYHFLINKEMNDRIGDDKKE